LIAAGSGRETGREALADTEIRGNPPRRSAARCWPCLQTRSTSKPPGGAGCSPSTPNGEAYVADAQGFIALTQVPRFKLYADKSLLTDFVPYDSAARDQAASKAERGNHFAERILVHEAYTMAILRWATSRPGSLIASVAPVPDVRFRGGSTGVCPARVAVPQPGQRRGRLGSDDDTLEPQRARDAVGTAATNDSLRGTRQRWPTTCCSRT